MKKILSSIMVAFLFISCQSGATSASSSSSSGSTSEGGQNYNPQFIRGFDASEVDFYEEKDNVKWKDTDGKEKDFFEILKAYGVNTVRLRIWNDPSQFSSSINTGDNTLERTVKMARRVKNAGLDLMLDFHYSDTWADPGRQIVPAAWKNLKTSDEIASALSEYTTTVLSAIKNQAGIVPRYVQVGNEINPGLLLHVSEDSNDNNNFSPFKFAGRSWADDSTGASGGDTIGSSGGDADGSSGADWDSNGNFVPNTMIKYLKAGASAVRAFDSSIKIVLHHAGGTWPDVSWFFDPVKNGGVPFDIIGYSFYPWETSGMTVQNLKEKIAFQKERYGVDVMVCECSSHWKDEGDLSAQKRTYKSMTDPKTGKIYSDLETGTDNASQGGSTGSSSGASSGAEPYVKGTVQNQANIIRHIIEETASSGGLGVFVWGGDLYGNYRWGMFDASGCALQSFAAFSQPAL